MSATGLLEGGDSVEADLFRSVMATVCSQVVVATTMAYGRPRGTTSTAFTSMSSNPPLVAVSLDRNSLLLAGIRLSGRVGINVLARGQEEVAVVCSGKEAGKFDTVPWTDVDGLPRIADTAGWLACDVWDEIVTGDRVLIVGHVVAAESTDDQHRSALVYANRMFGAHPHSA